MEPEFTSKPALGDSQSGSELQHAWQHTYTSLLKLKRAIDSSGVMADSDSNEPVEDGKINDVFGLETDLPQSLIYLRMSREDLTEFKLMFTHLMILKPHYEEHIAETASLGQNELWSSTNLYRHLQMLQNTFHISSNTSASAHAWIEAFFLRASAMLPQNQHMVLKMMKDIVPADRDPDMFALSRLVDYTAIVADQQTAIAFLGCPLYNILKIYKPSTFFIIKAKDPSEHVPSQVCQAVYQMSMCGKLLQKKVVCGALTNGHDWIFLHIKLNDNYEGPSYMQSNVIKLEVIANLVNGQQVIPKPWPDLIAAILLHWMRNSSADIGNDDGWFEFFAM